MKNLVVVAAATMLVAATTMSQDAYFSSEGRHKTADLDKASQRYVLCLKESNQGVVQSALAHLVHMKLTMPATDFPAVEAEVKALSATSDSPSIRYQAYLASLVFENPAMFRSGSGADYDSPEELFSTIASRVQVSVLGKQDATNVPEK
ncbi:MAG: hypothetical protein H6Q32_1063 [Bacteroidetes bacterium]|nr:hypothetical protein [Bacteroidota bacterium]